VRVTPWPLFNPRKVPVLIVQEAGWAPGPVWTGAENLAATGIRSPDRPAHSQSLYRLSYPAHKYYVIHSLNPSYIYNCFETFIGSPNKRSSFTDRQKADDKIVHLRIYIFILSLKKVKGMSQVLIHITATTVCFANCIAIIYIWQSCSQMLVL